LNPFAPSSTNKPLGVVLGSRSLKVFASGGIGNQLFQFAFSLHAQRELGLHSEFFNLNVPRRTPHQNFDLSPFLPEGLKSSVKSPKTPKSLMFCVDPWHSLRFHHVWGRRYDFRFIHDVSPRNLPKFECPAHVIGYFQHHEFLKSCGDEIVETLLNLSTKPSDSRVSPSSYEVIHIRGGDYLKGSHPKTIGNLSPAYYQKLLTKESNLPRIVVTDDLTYAQHQLVGINIDEFLNSTQCSPHETLYIFGRAKRIYPANSTFSWFGAYLANELFDAEVIIPNPFFKSKSLNYGHGLQSPNFEDFRAVWN